MTSERSGGLALFAGVLSAGPVADLVGGEAWLGALLEAESALATVCAGAGLIPVRAAQRVVAECAGQFDVVALGQAAAGSGNPVVPLVAQLRERCGSDGRYVHHGATSQDVLDTAMMLVGRRALAALVIDARGAADRAAALAGEHATTLMIGRTLLQQALPTTFGLVAAGWADGLDQAVHRLEAAGDSLPAQLAGPVGTNRGYGPWPELVTAYAGRLGLAVPRLPWHTTRVPVADLAAALGTSCGVVAKIALDVALLAQDEVGELTEQAPGRGGSSSMTHKHNPVAAVSARAAALRAPGLVATVLTAMAQEHQRAAGAWHAEWETVSDLLRVTGSALAWLGESLGCLQVDDARMRTNLHQRGAAPDAGEAEQLVALVLARRRGLE